MTNLKKQPFNQVDDEVISMTFDDNPNIPTANYSEETLKNIQETIRKKRRAEKIKKMIEQELKTDKKTEEDEMAFSFSFKSM